MVRTIIEFFSERIGCLIFAIILVTVGMISPSFAMRMASHAINGDEEEIDDIITFNGDGPEFDEHFQKHIDTYAEKHPMLLVRQLSVRLRDYYRKEQ